MSDQRVTLSLAGLTLAILDDAPILPVWLTDTCRPFHAAAAAPVSPAFTFAVHRNPAFQRTEQGLVYELGREPGSFRLRGFDFVAERRRCGLPIEIEAHPEAGMAGVMRWLLSIVLLENGGFMFHAASFAWEGGGIAAAGPSDSGKTTLSRLLRPRPDVALFTDDSTGFRFQGEAPVIYATPFPGELGLVSGPASAPLEAVFFLRHAPDMAVRPLEPPEIVAKILGSTFLAVRHGPWLERCLALAERLARTVPCYELGFRPEPSVWETIRHVIAAPVASA